MVAKSSHDWNALKVQLKDGLKTGKVQPNWVECAKYLGLHPATFRTGLEREWNLKHPKDLIGEGLVEEIMPTRLGLDVAENENLLEVNWVGEHSRTVEDLIRVCKIDTAEWECVDQKPNSWNSAMKIRKGETEHVVIVPLYQIKAYFRKRHPTPIMPMIQPVEVVISKRDQVRAAKPKAQRADGVRRALIVPDPQIGFRRRLHTHELDPFHDRRALDLAVQIAKAERVDSVEFIGDWLDMPEFSTRWTPEPEFYWTTQPALIEAAWWLGQFDFVPTKRLLEGNHERRIRDWINQYARAAYALRPVDELELPASLSIERLIPMQALGVDYRVGYPGNGYWLNDNVRIEHGDVVRSAAGATAGAVITKSTYTTIFGHIHRRELVSRRIQTRDGDAFQTAFCPGCTCRVDGSVPGSTPKDQWQQGLGLVEYTQDTENIIPISVQDGQAIYNGRVFRARDNLDAELNAMIESRLAKMKM